MDVGQSVLTKLIAKKQSILLEKEGVLGELHSVLEQIPSVDTPVIAQGWIKRGNTLELINNNKKNTELKGNKNIVKTKHLKPEQNRLYTIEK